MCTPAAGNHSARRTLIANREGKGGYRRKGELGVAHGERCALSARYDRRLKMVRPHAAMSIAEEAGVRTDGLFTLKRAHRFRYSTRPALTCPAGVQKYGNPPCEHGVHGSTCLNFDVNTTTGLRRILSTGLNYFDVSAATFVGEQELTTERTFLERRCGHGGSPLARPAAVGRVRDSACYTTHALSPRIRLSAWRAKRALTEDAEGKRSPFSRLAAVDGVCSAVYRESTRSEFELTALRNGPFSRLAQKCCNQGGGSFVSAELSVGVCYEDIHG